MSRDCNFESEYVVTFVSRCICCDAKTSEFQHITITGAWRDFYFSDAVERLNLCRTTENSLGD